MIISENIQQDFHRTSLPKIIIKPENIQQQYNMNNLSKKIKYNMIKTRFYLAKHLYIYMKLQFRS